MNFPAIAVIYNPNSTHSSQAMAQDFMMQLQQRLPEQNVELLETKRAGHGEELSYTFAKKYKKPLIVSVSGDGGYNDVVNGIMKAKHEGYDAVAGLLPAGNANDHYRAIHNEDSIEQIATATTKPIDVLCLTATAKGVPIARYAHSYIGFGLTPAVGKELNKNNLNVMKEIYIAVKSFIFHTSIPLKINGVIQRYESVVCSNIDTMSKYLKISQPSSLEDGKFEVTAFRKRHKLQLLHTLLKTSLGTVTEDDKTSKFSFETVQPTLAQADGEIIALDANCAVTVVAHKQALECIV